MACEAAKRHVVEVLRFRRDFTSAEEVWKRIGWWTPATIREALDELVEAGTARVVKARIRRRGPAVFRRLYDLMRDA